MLTMHYVCAWTPQRPKEGTEPLESGVADVCELCELYVGAEN